MVSIPLRGLRPSRTDDQAGRDKGRDSASIPFRGLTPFSPKL